MFKKVKPYMGEYIHYTRKAVLCVCVAIICGIIPYFLLYRLIVPLIEKSSLSFANVSISIALIAVFMVGNALFYVKGLSYSHISAYNTLKNIRISLQKKLEAQPLGVIQQMGNGRIKKVFTDDIETIELLLAHAIPEGIANMLIPLIAIAAMFFVDWKITLLCIASFPIGMFAIGMMFKAGMEKMDSYYAAGARMNNTIIEYINGMEVVKVFNRDEESYARFEKDIASYRDFTLAWYRVCWPWMALYSSIVPCIMIFALPAGGWLVLNGYSTLENFILIMCMSFAVGTPILKAMGFGGKFPQLNYKIDELEKIIDNPPLKQSQRKFEGTGYDISFENVSFSYDSTEVVHGINLSLKEGQLTALVGESGSGKSTLAKLLVHFYDLDSGRITLGGQDISDMSIEALNEKISYVSQEQFLFNTSLYDNILIGKPQATKKEVLEAARRAQCEEFLKRLPNGIDTMAKDGGKMLSGGERQRISLARALLKDAPVIVLDEATAFIDPENEEKMNKAISEIVFQKTVLVIAHRLPTIKNADKIIVLNKGSIAAEGTHYELLQTSEEYARLWKSAEESTAWEVKA